MYVEESFVCGKRSDQSLCEDGFVVTPNFAAVVDGSTSKVAGRAGGREAMQIVTRTIATLPGNVPCSEAVGVLTEALAAHNDLRAKCNAEYRLTCSAIIYSAVRREVWMIGDCQCRFGWVTHTNNKLVDSILIKARCEAVRYLLSNGFTPEDIQQKDLGRAMIFDALREQTNFQNDHNPLNPYAYAVLDGTPVLMPQVKTIGIGNSEHLILASDGYPLLCDTLSESEKTLQHLLDTDPLCIAENAATKCLVEGNLSFDDRCFLKLNIR